MIRHSVDLPEPDGPITITTSPAGTSSSMFFSTCKGPKCLSTSCIEIIGVACAVRRPGCSHMTSLWPRGVHSWHQVVNTAHRRCHCRRYVRSSNLYPMGSSFAVSRRPGVSHRSTDATPNGSRVSSAVRSRPGARRTLNRVSSAARPPDSPVADLAGQAASAAPAGHATRSRTYGCQMNVHDSERHRPGCWSRPGTVPTERGETADVVVFNTCAVRENADNKLYGNLGHLARSRRPTRHADRGRRLPGAEGPRRDRAQGALGRRGVRHAQRRLAAGAAGAGPAQRRGRGGDPGVARGLPVHPAGQARLDLRRLGVHLGGLQQHLHVLHRAVAARQGEGPPPGRRPGRGRRCCVPRACSR